MFELLHITFTVFPVIATPTKNTITTASTATRCSGNIIIVEIGRNTSCANVSFATTSTWRHLSVAIVLVVMVVAVLFIVDVALTTVVTVTVAVTAAVAVVVVAVAAS